MNMWPRDVGGGPYVVTRGGFIKPDKETKMTTTLEIFIDRANEFAELPEQVRLALQLVSHGDEMGIVAIDPDSLDTARRWLQANPYQGSNHAANVIIKHLHSINYYL